LYFLLVFVKFVHLCLEQDKVHKRRGSGNPVYN